MRKMYTLPNVCFMCFSKHNLKSIFHNLNGNKVAKQVKFLLPEIPTLKLKSTLHLYLCSNCCSSLGSAYAFKRRCLKKYNRFNTYINILQAPIVSSDHRLIVSQKVENTQNEALKEEIINIDEKTEDSLIEVKDVSEHFEQSEVEENVDGKIYIKSQISDVQNGDECVDRIQNKEQGTRSQYTSDVKNEVDGEINQQPLDGSESVISDDVQDDGDKEQKIASNENYKCTICSKTYLYRCFLVEHLKQHAGIKEYKCQICHKRYGKKSVLKRHIYMHTGIRNFECSICKKKYYFKNALNDHMKTHASVKDFKCNICGKEYFFKHVLTTHLKLHTGVNEFKCEFCDKSFINKKDAQNHAPIHSTD